MWCCGKDGQAKSDVKNFVSVFRGLRKEIDSVKAMGSKEVGGFGEESNVMNSDEHTKEFQNVEFDPRLRD